jgi:fructosamine-3-kinase
MTTLGQTTPVNLTAPSQQIGAPPLDGDLGSVDTSFPLLSDREPYYDLRVEKVEMKTSKAGKAMASVQLVNVAPATGMKGEQLPAGSVSVFENLNLEPSGKSDWNIVTRNVAQVVQAAGLTSKNGFDWKQFGATTQEQCMNGARWLPQLQGKIIRAKVGYEPAGTRDGKNYREKNVIVTYVPAK